MAVIHPLAGELDWSYLIQDLHINLSISNYLQYYLNSNCSTQTGPSITT